MRIVTLIMLVFIAAGNTCRAQSSLFETATQQADSEHYAVAVGYFNQIIHQQPSSDTLAYCYHYLANCYFQLHNYDSAKSICLLVLRSNFQEIGAIGTNSMVPSTNYKHHAARILSDIYEYQHQYDSALHYLILSNGKYELISNCMSYVGIGIYDEDLRYSRLYEKTGQHKLAKKRLLKIAFYQGNGYKEVLSDLKKLLLQDNHTAAYKRALKSAVNKIKIGSITNPKYRDKYYYYYINFAKTKMFLPYKVKSDPLNDNDTPLLTKKPISEKLQQSSFYKMVENL